MKPLALLRRDAPEFRAPLRLARPLLAGTAAIAGASAAALAYRMIQAWKPALLVVENEENQPFFYSDGGTLGIWDSGFRRPVG